MIKNVINNYKHIAYTLKHINAFAKTEKKLTGWRIYLFHDWDKIFLYVFLPFLAPKFISRFHQRHSNHHPTYIKNGVRHLKPRRQINFVEAVIDWECARYTKPDKPLDAYNTMKKYYKEYESDIMPILNDLALKKN